MRYEGRVAGVKIENRPSGLQCGRWKEPSRLSREGGFVFTRNVDLDK